MNPLIKDQLNKVKWITLPDFDDNTTHMMIPKSCNNFDYQVGNFYIIELHDCITNPPSNSLLSSNWNKGIIPRSKYIRCEVMQSVGNMINVGCIGYDITTGCDLDDVYESLWLPKDNITLVKNLGV